MMVVRATERRRTPIGILDSGDGSDTCVDTGFRVGRNVASAILRYCKT